MEQLRRSELVAKTRLGTNVKKTVLAATFNFAEEDDDEQKKEEERKKEGDEDVVVLDGDGGGKDVENDDDKNFYYFEGRKVLGISYRAVVWTGRVTPSDSA